MKSAGRKFRVSLGDVFRSIALSLFSLGFVFLFGQTISVFVANTAFAVDCPSAYDTCRQTQDQALCTGQSTTPQCPAGCVSDYDSCIASHPDSQSTCVLSQKDVCSYPPSSTTNNSSS